MNNTIKELISRYEEEDDFTRMSPTPEMLAKVKSELGVDIPTQFLEYLNDYSYGGIGGVRILGIGFDNSIMFMEETQEYREDGLPHKFIVVENCGEFLYCVDSETGEIVSWSPYDDLGALVCYPDFDSYLLERLQDTIDNR